MSEKKTTVGRLKAFRGRPPRKTKKVAVKKAPPRKKVPTKKTPQTRATVKTPPPTKPSQSDSNVDSEGLLKAIRGQKAFTSGDANIEYNSKTGKYTLTAFGTSKEMTASEVAKRADLDINEYSASPVKKTPQTGDTVKVPPRPVKTPTKKLPPATRKTPPKPPIQQLKQTSGPVAVTRAEVAAKKARQRKIEQRLAQQQKQKKADIPDKYKQLERGPVKKITEDVGEILERTPPSKAPKAPTIEQQRAAQDKVAKQLQQQQREAQLSQPSKPQEGREGLLADPQEMMKMETDLADRGKPQIKPSKPIKTPKKAAVKQPPQEIFQLMTPEEHQQSLLGSGEQVAEARDAEFTLAVEPQGQMAQRQVEPQSLMAQRYTQPQAQQAAQPTPAQQKRLEEMQKKATAQMESPEYQALLEENSKAQGQNKEVLDKLQAIQAGFKTEQESIMGGSSVGALSTQQAAQPQSQQQQAFSFDAQSFGGGGRGGGGFGGFEGGGGYGGGGDQTGEATPQVITKGLDGKDYPNPAAAEAANVIWRAQKAEEEKAVDDPTTPAPEPYVAPEREVTRVGEAFDPNAMLKEARNAEIFQQEGNSVDYNPETGNYTVTAFGSSKEMTPEEFAKQAELNMEDFQGVDPSLQTQDEDIEKLGDHVSIDDPDAVEATEVTTTEGEVTEAELEADLTAGTYDPTLVSGPGVPIKAAEGEVSRVAEAEGPTLTERAEAAERDPEQEEAAMGTAAQRPDQKDYVEAQESDKQYIIDNPDDPEVSTRIAEVVGPEELERLRQIAKGRGVPISELPEFAPILDRVVQEGTAASREATQLDEAPQEEAAQAEFYGVDYTPQGGNTEIDEIPAFKKAAERTAQVGEAAKGIAAKLEGVDPVDLEGREAILGTAPKGDAAQIGGIPTMEASQMQAVTGPARIAAAQDMASVVANMPEEVTAAIAEDPATVEAQLDTDPDPKVIAAVAALPEEALVSVQMENLLAGMEDGKTPAWARPAVAAIEQQMAARGLSASTVGRDALFNAIIQSALPMAQSNAQALQQRAQQNLSNEQQANLASAQNTMQVRMANLANRQTAASQTAQMSQQIKVQQGQFRQEAKMLSAQQLQQTEMANFQAAQQKAQQESSQRQQTALANLDAGTRIDLANLQAINAAEGQNLTARQQVKLASYQAEVNKVMKQAELEQDMTKVNLSSSLQIEMTDLNNKNMAAKDTMTAENQQRLFNIQTLIDFKKTNASFSQQMELANLSNDQQMRLAELQDRAATDTANFSADNQFELAELTAKVQRASRQAELDQRMEEVNLDARVKVELSELSERNTTSRANMSAEQQTRLANLNVLVDFRKTNAAMAQQMDLANMGNEQQMELANLAERSAVEAGNFTEKNRFRFQELNTHVQVMSQNEALKQQADLANLSMEEKISLANLHQKNQAESENMSAENVAELQMFEKKMGAAQVNAQLAQQMGLANLSNKQQAAMFNGQIDANLDMKQFDANQQMQLANSQFMQTMTVKDMDNRQQAAMQNATMMAQMDLASADQRTKLAITNAQNFLQMDMANLSNEQQALVLDEQMAQQRLLSDQAASNASKQFNATSENQTNQFMASMSTQVSQFNASQSNAMSQFNASEANRQSAINAGNELEADRFNTQITTQVEQFNSQAETQREQWNAANAQAIEQSNIAWRRNANTINSAAENAANQQNVAMQFDMDKAAQANLWQTLRDDAAFNFQAEQSERDRMINVVNAALSNESFMTDKKFSSQRTALFNMLSKAAQNVGATAGEGSSGIPGDNNNDGVVDGRDWRGTGGGGGGR